MIFITGVSFEMQQRAIRSGVHILVATPGRALDHISRGTIDLSNVKHVVLDEVRHNSTFVSKNYHFNILILLFDIFYFLLRHYKIDCNILHFLYSSVSNKQFDNKCHDNITISI